MPLNKYPDNEEIGNMNNEKRFLTACACFKSCLYEELQFLSLGDGLRPEIIPILHKLVKLLQAIFLLGKEMARTCPDCLTVRNRPTDHFLVQFERMCNGRIMAPLTRAIADLEADELLPTPKASVDFYVSADLDDCRADASVLLSGDELPLDIADGVQFPKASRPWASFFWLFCLFSCYLINQVYLFNSYFPL